MILQRQPRRLVIGDDLFGGPDWKTMVPAAVAAKARESGAVPLLRDSEGTPIKRNFVHVDDLVSAILLALVLGVVSFGKGRDHS